MSPHPRKTKIQDGHVWHLEDFNLTKASAESLSQHLRHREDKHARITKTPQGYEVWWTSNHR